jgi:hypothetical protein
MTAAASAMISEYTILQFGYYSSNVPGFLQAFNCSSPAMKEIAAVAMPVKNNNY